MAGMADTKQGKRNQWEKRVEQWRASGLSSTEFCKDRDFTPGGLRHWAHRLRVLQGQSPGQQREPVRFARVVRACASEAAPQAAAARTGEGESSLTLELQGVRIAVRSGFCAVTLGAVLDVLEQRASLSRRPS
jgi:transposase